MKNFLSLTLILILAFSCNKDKHRKTKAIDFIPENTSFAFKINNIEAFNSDLKNNNILNVITPDEKVKTFQSYLSVLKYLKTDNDVVFAVTKNEACHFVTKYNDSLIIKDSTNIKELETIDYKKNVIRITKIENDTLFNTIIDSFFIISTNKKFVENLISNGKSSRARNNYKELKSSASLSLYMNENATIPQNLNLLGNYTMLDMDLSQNNLSFSGVTKINDSLPSTINYISGTKAKENKLVDIIPFDNKGFISYTFDDFNKVATNYDVLNKVIESDSLNNIQDLIIEIGKFNLNNSNALAIRSIDAGAINESINSAIKETFRQIEINELDIEQNLEHLFHPLILFKNNKYLFTLDNFTVFTESVEDAQEIISNYTNKSTLAYSDTYKNAQENISDESSILYYRTSSELDSVFINHLPKQFTKGISGKSLKKNHSQLIQLINDNGFAHVNMLIQPIRKRAVSNTISEEYNITLDKDLLNDPQIVKNHITGQKDIAVQDVENNLYLISNRGRVLWKKKINGNILGKIEQIDIYKNGRLQLVFATPKEIYILDRNGKSVPFPKRFNDEITQPLSVFDYDNKRNYRFLVTQGKNTLMYDSKGKRVNGFTFKSASKQITSQPKHFRVGSKDYIVFGAGEKMYILNRKGQARVTAKESIAFSNNDIHLYKNNFTVTNASGQLVQVDHKGRVFKQNLMLPADHDFTATSKTLTTMADNKLTIKSKSIELDFGEYTAPKIFYLKDKIYVSVTDLQTQKVYLFDSQARLLPNFPIYGNSSISLNNLDKGKNLEVVVKGDSNSVLIYTIN